VNYLVWAIAILGAGYPLIALIACFRHLLSRDPEPGYMPPVSILKPVHGVDPQMQHAVRTHLEQDYPEFELLCGVADLNDPAVSVLGTPVVHCPTKAPNGKVGVLTDLDRAARFPIRVINDSDISVPRDYLQRVVAPLADPSVGVVTCLYRAGAESFPGKWEALGIATDFAPSVLVAPLFGINEFALGSTIAYRAEDFARTGGFPGIADYIADDYQLGKRISGLGKKVWLSQVVVETQLGGETFGDVWAHQLRWARTIRLARGAYAGLPFTNTSLWALGLLVLGAWKLAAALLVLRLVLGVAVGWGVLRSGIVLRYWYLMPFRDLWGFGVWLAGMTGDKVVWRDRRLTLDHQGRIIRIA
jgi:ceramide glucosyltransferase